MTRLPNIIETVTGLGFDYTDPVIKLDDVAHGLAHECRFAGHTTRFYSVAEHSILVAGIVEQMQPALALAALWHDAHEAYMGDCPTPLKAILGDEWRKVADRIDVKVVEFIGYGPRALSHPFIKYADKAAMLYEASILKPGPGWAFTRDMDHTTADRAAQEYSLNPLGTLLPSEAAEAFKAVDLHLRDLA